MLVTFAIPTRSLFQLLLLSAEIALKGELFRQIPSVPSNDKLPTLKKTDSSMIFKRADILIEYISNFLTAFVSLSAPLCTDILLLVFHSFA